MMKHTNERMYPSAMKRHEAKKKKVVDEKKVIDQSTKINDFNEK
jgi:hypothetical protein